MTKLKDETVGALHLLQHYADTRKQEDELLRVDRKTYMDSFLEWHSRSIQIFTKDDTYDVDEEVTKLANDIILWLDGRDDYEGDEQSVYLPLSPILDLCEDIEGGLYIAYKCADMGKLMLVMGAIAEYYTMQWFLHNLAEEYHDGKGE